MALTLEISQTCRDKHSTLFSSLFALFQLASKRGLRLVLSVLLSVGVQWGQFHEALFICNLQICNKQWNY